ATDHRPGLPAVRGAIHAIWRAAINLAETSVLTQEVGRIYLQVGGLAVEALRPVGTAVGGAEDTTWRNSRGVGILAASARTRGGRQQRVGVAGVDFDAAEAVAGKCCCTQKLPDCAAVYRLQQA